MRVSGASGAPNTRCLSRADAGDDEGGPLDPRKAVEMLMAENAALQLQLGAHAQLGRGGGGLCA